MNNKIIIDNFQLKQLFLNAYDEYLNKYLGHYDVPDIYSFLYEIINNQKFAETQNFSIKKIYLNNIDHPQNIINHIFPLHNLLNQKIIVHYKNQIYEKIN
jgi:hypothetical protein